MRHESCSTIWQQAPQVFQKQPEELIMTHLSKSAWFWALILVFSSWRASIAEETVRIAVGEWSPLHAESLPNQGVASRIIAEAFALEGIRVEYGFFPWARSYAYVEQGEWDGTALWSASPEREQLFIISDPVLSLQIALFHLKRIPFDWQSVADLQPLWIGTIIGSSYGADFDTAIQAGQFHIEAVPTEEQNFKKLLTERLQVVPVETIIAAEVLRTKFSAAEAALITHHPKLLAEQPHHLLFKKTIAPHIVEAFNRGLQRLKESGAYERILVEGLGAQLAQELMQAATETHQ